MITAVYLENPFKPQNRVIRQFDATEAATVLDAAALLGAAVAGDFILSINGNKANAETQLSDGDFVVIAPNVLGGGGGGGKNIVGIVAGIALMAFSGGAGAGLLGFLGTTQGTLGLGLALYFGGSLLMGNQKNPTIDAPKVEGAFEGGYNWSPNQIKVQPGTPIPLTYGAMRTSGQLISRRVWSGEIGGKPTQYLGLLLAAGEGPLNSITDIKINDTPIASIDGAVSAVSLGTNNQAALNVAGLAQVVEFQAFSSELPISTSSWITKAQTEAGDRVVLDFVFPAGLYAVNTANGATVTGEGAIRWEYREVGAGSWISGATVSYSQSARKPFYFSITFTPPDASKCYEFRAQNYTLKYYQDTYGGAWLSFTEMPGNYSCAMSWVGLTATSNRVQTYPGIALVAIILPATENLSGSMPRVSWTQTRAYVNVWNPTSEAYEQADAQNIAWIVYDLIHQCKLLRNIQTGLDEYVVFGEPKENLNFTEFVAWASFCQGSAGGAYRAKGNLLVDSADQMWPTIQKIATSARAFIIQQAGVFKPVWDSTRSMSQIFTAGNIIDGSLSGSFLPERERATAIEVSFLNEDNGYERDTLFVPGDDYNPADLDNPTQIYLPGITNSDTAYMWAKHHLKKNKYLKRTQTLQADIDSIVAELGDVVGIQSDVTSWGTGGRIMGATTTSVVIDQAVTLEPGSAYSLLVRFPDNTLVRRVIDAVLVSTTTTTLGFTTNPWTTAPERYCVYSFGANNLETKPFMITGIRRNGDLQATLELLEYVADVYTEATDFPVIDYTAANTGISSLTVNPDDDTGKLGIAWTIPVDRDYTGSVVFVDGKPQGFFPTDVTDVDIDMPPGTYTVTVRPVDGSGNYGTGEEEEITLGSPTLSSVSSASLTSTVRGQADGTNLVYITGTFTIPDLANSVLVEIGEGSNPAAWATVQDSRVAAVQYGPVLPGTLYTLRFTAKNRYAVADPVLEPITTAGDTTAPNAPSIGVTSYLKTVTIQISLATVPSDMAGFAIYRHTSNNSAAASQIGSVTSKDGRATYTDKAPAYGSTYYYWVKSFDTWGNPSAFSYAASTLITAISGSDIVDGALSRSALFAAGVVDATAIGAAAVTAAKTAIAAIDAATGNLNNNVVGELQIANDAVTAAKLNVAGIDGTTGAIAAGAVAELQLANDAVTAAKLNVAAIDGVSGNIVANAVGELQLASNAVTAAKIKAGEVGADALAAGAVTELKLANDAVTAAKLNVAAIDGVSGAIVANAVGELQLANDAVTAAKLNVAGIDGTTGAVAAGAVAELQLASAAVTEAKIATAAVNTAQISTVALKTPLGAVLSLSAKNSTTASIAEAGGVRDVSGNGNHGQAFNGVTLSDSEIGKAFNFSGSARISIPAYGQSGYTTLSVWCKRVAMDAGWKALFSDAADDIHHMLLGNGVQLAEWGVGVWDGVLRTFGTYQIPDDGKYHHLAMVYNSGSTVDLYADGVFIAQSATTMNLTVNKIGQIGNYLAGAYPCGSLAHPKIFGRALSAAEIKALCMFPEDAAFGNITADLITTGELITKTAQIKDAIISSAKISDLSADKINAGTLAAARIAAGSLAADKITGGAIVVGGAAGDVNAGVTTISGGKITASSISSDKLLIGKSGSALNTDPNFEDPSAWTSIGSLGSGYVLTQTAPAAGKVGTAVAAIYANSNRISTVMIPVDSGKVYRLRVWAKNDTASDGAFYLILWAYTAIDSAFAEVQLVGGAAIGASWEERSGIYTPAADIRYVRAQVAFWSGTAGYLTLQDLRLEEVLPATLIQDGAIITDKLAAGSVTASKVTSGELITLTAQIKDAIITSAKINDLSADKINAGTLAAARIAAGSLAADKITGGAIVIGGAAGDINSGATTIAGGKITTGSVTATQLASDSVTTDKLAAGAVTAAKVTSGELITLTAQIKDAVVTSAKISDLSADKINAGTLAAARIAAGSLSADKITGGALVVGSAAGDVNAGATTISGGKITANSLTADRLIIGQSGAALNPDPYFLDSSAWFSDGSDGPGFTLATVTDGKIGQAIARLYDTLNRISSAKIPVAVDKLYRVRGYARSGAAGCDGFYVIVWEYDAAGTLLRELYPGSHFNAILTPVWTEKAGAYQPSADAKFARIQIACWSVAPAENYIEVQDFRLEEMAPATLIQDGAVTTDKIYAGAVTAEKITSSELLTLSAQIKDAIVTDAKIATLSATKITAGTLDAARIAAGSISAEKLASGSVTTAKLDVTAIKMPAGAAVDIALKGSTTASIAATDGAIDVSGNANHGTATSGVSVIDSEIGKALQLVAAGAVVSLKSPVGQSGYTTLSAWYRRSASAAIQWRSVFADPTADIHHMLIGETWNVCVWDGALRTFNGYVIPNDGAWHHLVMVYNSGSTVDLYADGVFIAQSATSMNLATNKVGKIGNYSGGGYYAGDVAHPKIYARALTLAEVVALYMLGRESETGQITADRIIAGAIDTNKLAAGAVTAVKLSAGCVETAALAAGAVTADKIAVGGGGAALNPDPSFMDASEWSQPQMITTISDGVVGSKTMAASTSALSVWNVKPLPFDKSKTYRLRVQARAGSGISTPSFTMYAYPCSTTGTIDSSYGVSSGSKSLTTSWAAFEYVFAGSAMAGSAQCQLRIRLNPSFSGTGAVQFQDFRIEEVIPGTLIQDGAITTDKLTANSVTAAKIATDAIKSTNYAASAGSFFDLSAGDLKLGGSSAPMFSFLNSSGEGSIAGITFKSGGLFRSYDAGSSQVHSLAMGVASGLVDMCFRSSFENGDVSEQHVTIWDGKFDSWYADASYSTTVSITPSNKGNVSGAAIIYSSVQNSTDYGFATNGRVYAAGGFYPTSDENAKSDINDVSVLSSLKTVRVKKYRLDDAKIRRLAREREIKASLRDKNAVIPETVLIPEPDLPDYNPNLSIGVMAADFNAAFGIGRGDKETYNLTDAIGVSLRAIQELVEIVDEQAAEIAELRAALNMPEKPNKNKKEPVIELTDAEIEEAIGRNVELAAAKIMQELKK